VVVSLIGATPLPTHHLSGDNAQAMERTIDLQALRTVLEGAEVASVEESPGELRLVLADGDQITVRAEPSHDPASRPDLRFFHEAVFSD
jgi:hypothetical protein